MIQSFSDHAANERTFLAWVRTGIAVIAFGFVIEKFDLFLITLERTAVGLGSRIKVAHLSGGPLGRYDGLAFIGVGIVIIVLATVRFMRTTALIDDPKPHRATGVRTELVVSAILVVLVASYSIYLAIT